MWSRFRTENAVPSHSGAQVSTKSKDQMFKEEEFKRRIATSLPHIVQKLAQEVKDNNSWAPVLRTAPEAIQAMALCLVASTEKKAGAIKITITGRDSEGKPIEQPYEYLSTNLQHCSDLGRLAFSDAERAMDCLKQYANEMANPQGMISQILEMVDDPEEARYSLRPAMEDLEETAERCKQEAESIKKKFVQLLDFILALRKATQEQSGKTSNQHSLNKERIIDGGRKQTVQEDNLTKLSKEIEQLEMQRDKDDAELREARKIVNSLVGISVMNYVPAGSQELPEFKPPPEFEPPAYEQPPKDSIMESGGVFGATRKFFAGESKSARAEYDKKCQEAWEEHQRLVSQLLQEHKERVARSFQEHKERVAAITKLRQEQLDIAQKDAERRLVAAKAAASSSTETLLASRKRLEDAQNKTWKISDELAKTKIDLQNLRDENLGLDAILLIIGQAIESLTFMVNCVSGMKTLFAKILEDVRHTMSDPLDKFLKEINTGVERSGNKRDTRNIENLEFTNTNKVNLTKQALYMQGKLLIISNIAGIYIQVSQRYITPAMNKMELLATVEKSRYPQASAEFQAWCKTSVAEIDRFSQIEKNKMSKNTQAGILTVARETLAIQAAPSK